MLNALVKSKFKAAALHFSVTMLIALLAAYLVFFVWFPQGLSKMLGGADLYWIVIAVELSLGPLISLIIFNPEKNKKELVRDYIMVAVIQVSALMYGLYVVAQSRPVFNVFVKDRIEVITAVEIAVDDLEQAVDLKYKRLSWVGPIDACVEGPKSPQEKSDMIFSGLAGKDIEMFPKYYRDCRGNEALDKAYEDEMLRSIIRKKAIPYEIAKALPEQEFTWLPVKHRFGAWVEVYSVNEAFEPYYIPIDPFEK